MCSSHQLYYILSFAEILFITCKQVSRTTVVVTTASTKRQLDICAQHSRLHDLILHPSLSWGQLDKLVVIVTGWYMSYLFRCNKILRSFRALVFIGRFLENTTRCDVTFHPHSNSNTNKHHDKRFIESAHINTCHTQFVLAAMHKQLAEVAYTAFLIVLQFLSCQCLSETLQSQGVQILGEERKWLYNDPLIRPKTI